MRAIRNFKRQFSPAVLLVLLCAVIVSGATTYQFGTSAGTLLTPAGYVNGNTLRYSSATVVTVGPGTCTSSDTLSPINLTASDTTVTITTANGAGGLNSPVLAQTATTHGTTAFEPSASIVASLNARTGTGTITTVGTALTGLSMNDLAPGDLVGTSTTYGWSQVVSWVPPTTPGGTNGTAVLSAALPGGDITAGAFTIIENATIWPGATAGDKRRISTLSANGLSVVVTGGALTSSAAGVALQIGVEISSCFYNIYAATVSGSPTAFMSTQRTTAYAMTGLSAYRRVGVIRNGTGGDIVPFSQTGLGQDRTYQLLVDNSTQGTRVLTNGTAASWTAIDASAVVPPTSRAVLFGVTFGQALSTFFRPRNLGGSTNVPMYGYSTTGGALAMSWWCFTDAAQCMDYVGGNVYVDIGGYVDDL